MKEDGDLIHHDMLLKKKDDNMLYFTYFGTGNNLYEERISIDKYLNDEYEIYELEKVIPTKNESGSVIVDAIMCKNTAELNPEREVYHLKNENITYKTNMNEIVVDTALRDLCNQIGERAKDKTTLILQAPVSFMDVHRPCSIAITKNWYDNNETSVWTLFDKSMLFASDRIVSHEHPSVIFTKAYYDADMNDCRDIECNDDEISKVLYGILSEVYNKPGKVIPDKTEEHLRIVYSE
jgi:hypothetical protein